MVDDSWHPRHVCLSHDLQTLVWERDEAGRGEGASTPRSKGKKGKLLKLLTPRGDRGEKDVYPSLREDDPDGGGADQAAASERSSRESKAELQRAKELHRKEMPMTTISALAEGAKTANLKKVLAKEGGSQIAGDLARTLTFQKGPRRPEQVRYECTFSIISRERTLDFAAASEESRAEWLHYLRLILVQQHTVDSDAVVRAGEGVGGAQAAIDALQQKVTRLKDLKAREVMSLRSQRWKSELDVGTPRSGPVSTRSPSSSVHAPAAPAVSVTKPAGKGAKQKTVVINDKKA